MKKGFTVLALFALSTINAYTQETLQTITDRDNSTSNSIIINPIYQIGSRIKTVGGGGGYFDIFNNSNNSISLALKRSDGASVFEIDGYAMNTYFGGNVGIGALVPEAKLHVAGNVKLSGNYDGTNNVQFSPAGGVGITWEFYPQTNGFGIFNRNSNFWPVFISNDNNIGIGTLTPNEKLAVNGKIRAHEIKVETANWPDYVFAKDYQLPTLEETEKHIKEKGHLPGIPSAAEAKANGVDLGEMNAKLLQKIEELTLYLIKVDKKVSVLQKENLLLKKQVRNSHK